MKSRQFSPQEKLVLAVLAYSAQFSHALTPSEIFHRLFFLSWLSVLEKRPKNLDQALIKTVPKTPYIHSLSQLQTLLESLVQKKKVVQKGSYFTLAMTPQALRKRDVSPLVEAYKNQLVLEMKSIAARFPWVEAVVITGSYAAGARMDKDDIDFLMITKKNRLWLTRLFFLAVSWLKGRRPHLPGGDISHSWDLNFWLDETRLALPPQRHSLYEGYEVLQTQWIVQKNSLYQRFMQENSWIEEYFPQKVLKFHRLSQEKLAQGSPPEKVKRSSRFSDTPVSQNVRFELWSSFLSFFSWEFWLNWCEKGAFLLQVKYREKRHGSQRADAHSAFFHPSSTRGKILKNWQQLYQKTLA